jgi:hypothetical protein
MHVNNIIGILTAAHRFHIVDVVHACVQFIEQQLQPNNALFIHRLAIEHRLSDLTSIVWTYVLVGRQCRLFIVSTVVIDRGIRCSSLLSIGIVFTYYRKQSRISSSIVR